MNHIYSRVSKRFYRANNRLVFSFLAMDAMTQNERGIHSNKAYEMPSEIYNVDKEVKGINREYN